jgi:hypothetical protein
MGKASYHWYRPARCLAQPSEVVRYFKGGLVRDVYLVEVEDRYLGKLYCTPEEAFTPEELAQKRNLHPLSPIDPEAIPGPVRASLRQLVADLRSA